MGDQFPDMVNASRPMKASEYADCAKAGASQVIEVPIGIDGLTLIQAKSQPALNLTTTDIYKALAANPFGKPNTATTWKDVNPALPAIKIRVLGPPPTSGTRDSLAELILTKGCESDPAMKALKKSDEKKHKDFCTKVREDGAFVEAGENDNLLVQKVAADPGALGVLGFSFLEENADKVAPVSLGGVAPTEATISDLSYPGSRKLYVYVKGEHMAAQARRSASSSPPMPRRWARAARSRSAAWCRSARPTLAAASAQATALDAARPVDPEVSRNEGDERHVFDHRARRRPCDHRRRGLSMPFAGAAAPLRRWRRAARLNSLPDLPRLLRRPVGGAPGAAVPRPVDAGPVAAGRAGGARHARGPGAARLRDAARHHPWPKRATLPAARSRPVSTPNRPRSPRSMPRPARTSRRSAARIAIVLALAGAFLAMRRIRSTSAPAPGSSAGSWCCWSAHR